MATWTHTLNLNATRDDLPRTAALFLGVPFRKLTGGVNKATSHKESMCAFQRVVNYPIKLSSCLGHSSETLLHIAIDPAASDDVDENLLQGGLAQAVRLHAQGRAGGLHGAEHGRQARVGRQPQLLAAAGGRLGGRRAEFRRRKGGDRSLRRFIVGSENLQQVRACSSGKETDVS